MQKTSQEQEKMWDQAKLFLDFLQNQSNQLFDSQQNFKFIEQEVKKIKSLEGKIEAQQLCINNNKIEADKKLKTIEAQYIQKKEYQTNIIKSDQQFKSLSDKVDKIQYEQNNQLQTLQGNLQNQQINFEKLISELEIKTKLIENQIKQQLEKEFQNLSQQINEKVSEENLKKIQQQVDKFQDKFNQQDNKMEEIILQNQNQFNKNQQETILFKDFTLQKNQQMQSIQDQINKQDLKSSELYQELKKSIELLQNEQVQSKENIGQLYQQQIQVQALKSQVEDKLFNQKQQVEQFFDSSINDFINLQKQMFEHQQKDVNLQQNQNQNVQLQNLNQEIIQEQNNQNQQQDQALQIDKIIQNQQFQENEKNQQQNIKQFQIKQDELKKQNEYQLDNKQNQKELNNKIDQQQIEIIQEEKNQKIQQQIINELNDLLEKFQNEENQIVQLNDRVYQDIALFDQQIYDINEQFKSIQQINILQYKPKGEEWNSFSEKIIQIQQQSKQQQNIQPLIKLYNELKGSFESANSQCEQISSKQINQVQIQPILQKLNKIKQQLNIQTINKSRDQCEEINQNIKNLQQELQNYQENYKQDIVNNEQLHKFTKLLSEQLVNTDIDQLKNQHSLRNQQFMELLERKEKIDQFCSQHQNIINSNQQIQELQQQIHQIIDQFSQMINFPENDFKQKQEQFTNVYQQYKIYDKSSLNETDENMQLSKKQFDQDIDKQNAYLQEFLQIYKNFDELNIQVINLYKRLTYTPPDAMITKFIYNLYKKTTYLRAVEYQYKPFVRYTEDFNQLKNHYGLKMPQGKKIKQYCNEIKPVRGDGNCFYTAFGFQFLKYLLLKYNDKEFNQFQTECEKMPMKLFLSENSPEITNKELETKILIELFNRLRRLRKIENLKERLNQLQQEYAAYEQSQDQIEQDGCLYALSTIFLRNYSNYAVDFHEMKDALFDRQNLLIWEKECNSNEIVIDALSRQLKLHSILIFIQQNELIFQKYGDQKYWKVILLMKPGHYNIGVDTAYEEELIKQIQDGDKKQFINKFQQNIY